MCPCYTVSRLSLIHILAQTLVPEGTVRKITSFIGGLLLLLVMLQPLLRTDLGSLRIHAEDYAAAFEERQAELESAENEALAQGIAERTAAYISDKANTLGLVAVSYTHLDVYKRQ